MERYGEFFEVRSTNKKSEIIGTLMDGFIFGGIASAIFGVVFGILLLPIWVIINRFGK